LQAVARTEEEARRQWLTSSLDRFVGNTYPYAVELDKFLAIDYDAQAESGFETVWRATCPASCTDHTKSGPGYDQPPGKWTYNALHAYSTMGDAIRQARLTEIPVHCPIFFSALDG